MTNEQLLNLANMISKARARQLLLILEMDIYLGFNEW